MKRYEATEALLETVDFAAELLAHHQTYMAKPQSSLAGQHEEAHRRLRANAELVRKAEPDSEYQGWTNRETWCVNLWLGNEEGLYQEARRIAQGTASKFERSEELAAFVGGKVDDAKGFQADLLQTSLARVNWAEIVNGLEEA